MRTFGLPALTLERIEAAKAKKGGECMTETAVYHDIHTARLIDGLTDTQRDIHALAIEKGWWDAPRNDGELIALIHSELSELLEALRNGNPPDDKLPEFSGAEVELADVVIRVLDMAEARGWRVAEAIVAKNEFNRSRPCRHGKKF